MKLTAVFTLCTIGLLATATAAFAQPQKKGRASPPATVTANIDGNEVKIAYSRPYTKDPKTGEPRKIWGGLVPYNQVWRTGANEATVLTIEKPIVIGGYELAAGKYSLFTVPTPDGGQLIINKKTGQWGIPYKEDEEKANELTRVALQRGASDQNLDQFTITIEKTGDNAGQIKFAWADAYYTVDFKNKS
jgi:hypothetical protein